jgi:hypothetical protein
MSVMVCGARIVALGALVALLFAVPAVAQTPQPFPRPGDRTSPARPPDTPPVRAPLPPGVPAEETQPQPQPRQPAAPEAAPVQPTQPTEAMLGAPVYPAARFITSYDAGRGQRYYLFGSTSSFAEMVQYYRTVLRTRGTLVYPEPPVYMFEVGRYRDDAVAFPPGVTIKDYTWGGSEGYLVPFQGSDPPRYPTIIQIVPPPGTP